MYDVVYDEMVDAGVAKKRETPVFMDKEGNVVSDFDSKRYGRKSDVEITHPNYILFANETGCNTCQKKDGHTGGSKFVCETGTVPSRISNTADHRYTLLPYTKGICMPMVRQYSVLLFFKVATKTMSSSPIGGSQVWTVVSTLLRKRTVRSIFLMKTIMGLPSFFQMDPLAYSMARPFLVHRMQAKVGESQRQFS
jgi:hypothetical protein